MNRVPPSGVAYTAFDRLYLLLKKRILNGEYHSGDRFPKIKFFVITEGISHPVVSRVFLKLESEKLAYKKLNRWVAGPKEPPVRSSARTTTIQSTVLVLTPSTWDWYISFEEPYTNSFYIPFMDQLVKHQFGLVVAAQTKKEIVDPAMAAGIEEVEAKIKAMGENYSGILMTTIYPVESQLQEWITRLAKPRKPIVYLDVVGLGGHLTRKSIPAKRDFFRLFTDERAACTLVLNALAQAGHGTYCA